MPINFSEVNKRWEHIRKLPECDLSLDPKAARRYYLLSESESTIVAQKIFDTLVQFADYRLEKKSYRSDGEAPGDLVTCEGLETFLIPAVEEVYPFSDFLDKYPAAQAFGQQFREDLNGLLDKWSRGNPEFSGEPYTNMNSIRMAFDQDRVEQFEPFNITETAAMACRICIHTLTLKHLRLNETTFIKNVCEGLDDDRLLKSLSNAIEFLAKTFQKSNIGDSDEEKIVNAKWGNSEGSGWSWTGGTTSLAPLLFFTAAVVDAFAELDLYLIRPGNGNDFAKSAPKIHKFYKDNERQLLKLQLCVDMARRWIRNTVLPNIAFGAGQYEEKYPDNNQIRIEYADNRKELTSYRLDWEKEGLKPPILYYNTLYALEILLWSFGDRSNDGTMIDSTTKSAINRALSLLVYNYDNIAVVKQVLSKTPHIFLLPGRGVFNSTDLEANCQYLDAGFLPLLTRLLILFVIFGVGDRNLEPIITNLYLELLQRRYRVKEQYSSLWSKDKIEVYSTQRAIQALTFYHAYVAGKDLAGKDLAGKSASNAGSVLLRNKTGLRFCVDFVKESDSDDDISMKQIPTSDGTLLPVEDFAALFKATFADNNGTYLNKINYPLKLKSEVEQPRKLQEAADKLVDDIFEAGCSGKLKDMGVAKILIDGLLDLYDKPTDGARTREHELRFLREMFLKLRA